MKFSEMSVLTRQSVLGEKILKYVTLSWGHPTPYCKIFDISGGNWRHKERRIKY